MRSRYDVAYRMGLLLNIFINDMFYFIENCYLCNYADDNALHVFDCNINVVK